MTIVSTIFFGLFSGILITMFRRGADPISPARVFSLIWCLAIGLADLKLSALQRTWSPESWILLLTGIAAFLCGTFIAYVQNVDRPLQSVNAIREAVRTERINEGRLFWLICAGVALYAVSYLTIYFVKGFLPVNVVGTSVSRVDFNVYGLGLFVNAPAFIIFFSLLYFLRIEGKRLRKMLLGTLCVLTMSSYLLLLQRYQIIMAIVLCAILLYYSSQAIRLKTALIPLALAAAFFYFISSLRFSNVVSTYLYLTSKMRFPKDFAMLTEPYMYVVMNLENFANAASKLDYHTYGYFTFDFVTAIVGLKHWLAEYFVIDRMPYLFSSYNTYSAFWWFYLDFGVIGLVGFPLLIGFAAGWLYYNMRRAPTLKRVTAYAIMVFVIVMSFFEFSFSRIWFEYNLLVIFLFLRWTVDTEKTTVGAPSTTV